MKIKRNPSFNLAALLVILIFLPLAIFISTHPRTTSAAWFDDSFAYRNLLAITSHTALESNVYITATINTSASGQFQADCGDLRFTDARGKLLKYYIVSGCTTASTVVHIFFESFPAGAQDLYYYYGNPNVANGFASADFSTVATSYVVGSVASQEKSPAPRGYWKFDEGNGTTTLDSTGNGYTGTLNSSPTWISDDQCVAGKCLRFNGSTSYVSTTTANNFTGSAITISMWLNAYTLTAVNDFFGNYDGGAFVNGDVRFYFDATGSLSAQFGTGAGLGVIYTNSNQKLTPNSWHYVVVNYDDSRGASNRIRIYMDGIQATTSVSQENGSGAVLNNAIALWIGGNNQAGTRFSGTIDDVKIFTYTRTAAQIKADYNAGKGHAAQNKGGNLLGNTKNNAEYLSNGLVGYWKLDEASGNAVDSSGNSLTATNNNVSTFTAGKYGNSTQLNGTNQSFSVTNNQLLHFDTNLTFSAWIKKSSTSSKAIISKRNNLDQIEYEFDVISGKVALYLSSNGSTEPCSATGQTTISTGTYNHVSATYDGNLITIYLNGVQDGSSYCNLTIYTGTANLGIGAYGDNSLAWFDGNIDEVRLYNRTLSPKEISDLSYWAPGPFAYFKLDENSGTTSGDSSGNNFTSSWTGSPSWITGKSGSALYFNGSSYVNFYSASLAPLFLGSSGSVSMWIKVPNSAFWTEGVTRTPFQIGTDANNRIMVQKTTTSNFIDLNYTAGASSTTYSYATTRTDWFHLAIVWSNPGYARFYVDGKRVQSSVPAATYTGSLASDRAVFGINTTSSNQWFTGSVDDLRLYNYPRTDAQIIEDMNLGHPTGGSPIGSQLAYFKFDEGYGSTTYNSGSTGSTQNGTITGATWTTSGKFGKALTFAGSTNQVSIPTITSASALSFWLNPSTNSQNLFALSATSYLTASSGTITATGFTSPTIYVNGVVNGKLNAGVWQHVAVTTDTPITANAITAGRANGTSLTGSIDEVKIYAGPLSSTDVLLDYNRGQALVLGTTGTDSTGIASDNSTARTYCIPGDTTSCSPPVAEWNFDEKVSTTANDTSGNGNTGTLTLGPTWIVGKIGSGIELDGLDDYVRALDSNSLDITGSHTIEAWVYPDSLPSSNRIRNIVSKTGDQDLDTAGTQTNYGLAIDNGLSGAGQGVSCGFEDAAHANYAGRYTVSLPTSQWSHLACVFDDTANTITIYVNGVFGSQTSIAGSPATQSQDLYIGISNASATFSLEEYFDGKIDQLKLFSYARNTAQIAWDYNRGAPIAHWKMDECQGTTLNDSSGSGFSGTWSGATGSQTAVGTCATASTAWGNGATGKFNSSLNFDGTDDVISTASQNSLGASGDFTYSTWIKTTTTNAAFLMSHEPSAGVTVGALTINRGTSGRYNAEICQASACTNLESNSTINDGNWHLLTLTRSGTTTSLYKDGKLDNSGTGTVRNFTGSVAFKIGGRVNNSSYFTGQLDDARIYNYSLTPSQIKQIYNNTSINFGPSTGNP